MLVYKFGGTSVGNAARFEAVADIIRSAEDPELLVVVSAMSGTTNALIAGARAAEEGDEQQSRLIKEQLLTKHLQAVEHLFAGSPERSHLAAYMTKCMEDYDRLCLSIATLGELTRRGIDAVASLGEQMSNRILAALLRQRGTPAQAIDATTCIRTDSEFGAATPDMDATRRLVTGQILPLLSKGIVPVVTGFIASNPRGVTTTLGRGGSDYSAAILGVSLDADEVWIWTDVNGILTADPKLVREARTLELLSYAEAEELAYFGASVLHPKTVTTLAERGIAHRCRWEWRSLVVAPGLPRPPLARGRWDRGTHAVAILLRAEPQPRRAQGQPGSRDPCPAEGIRERDGAQYRLPHRCTGTGGNPISRGHAAPGWGDDRPSRLLSARSTGNAGRLGSTGGFCLQCFVRRART